MDETDFFMGDMADYYLDQAFDDHNFEREDDDGPPISWKTCRNCGTPNLIWGATDTGFRLFTLEGKLHSCYNAKLIPMDANTRTFFIAGVQYNTTYRDYLPDAKVGDILKLVGEPTNKFDRYAVRIESPKGSVLGHIPKPFNVDTWALKDAGFKPTAILIEVNTAGPSWNMFKVEVTFAKQAPVPVIPSPHA